MTSDPIPTDDTSDDTTSINTELASPERPTSSTTSASGPPRSFPDTVYERGLLDPGLAPFVNEATADLVVRLDIDATAVETLTAVLVVWPDASLGCPDPALRYAQVATDGSVIELGVGDDVYRYHTGGTQRPFLCERPLERPPAA